jgi:hypothetical protein
MKTASVHSIELLESRIAPASAFVTYTDRDGDLVKITASNAIAVAPPLDVTDLTLTGGATAISPCSISPKPASTARASLSPSPRPPAADGLADVTRINAGTNDLGAVLVKGDLADIDAGSSTFETPAIASLSVRSMGLYGNGGTCDIQGSLGSLKVTGDVRYAYVHVFGDDSFSIGPVTIGGSLVGSVSDNSGRIYADGAIGAVRIGGDVQGGAGLFSGSTGARGS